MTPTHVAVRQRAKGIIKESWQSQANLSVFLVLQVLIAFILPSLGFGKVHYEFYVNMGFSILLISGVAIGWGRRLVFPLGIVVGIVALAMRWLSWWAPTPRLTLVSDWLTLAAIIVIAIVLLAQVFRAGQVTAARLQGAIAVYLLFGIAWAHAYHITSILHPGSFNVTDGVLSTVADWIYFSYVTLTTVGYGDITPKLPIARNLAVVEALTGQIYLAVLVARLVAMEVIAWQEKASRAANR
jgi:hypothetical protein